MRSGFLVLFCLFFISLSANCEILQAGISFNETTAKIEAFREISKNCPFETTADFERSSGFKKTLDDDEILSVQEFEIKILKIIPVKFTGVTYKSNPNFVYYYIKNKQGYKCEIVEVIYDDAEPFKVVNYAAKTGKMISVALITSENESFIYDAQGELMAHLKGDRGLSFKDKQNMLRKIIYSME